jgi:hypothetical protein
MATTDDLVTADKNRNQLLSLLVTTLQNTFPVGGANAKLKSFTVATMPGATSEGAGTMIYVSDAATGAIPAFSDGTDWRRVDTRAVIT